MKSRMEILKFSGDTGMFTLLIISIAILILETTVARLYIFLTPSQQSLQINIVLFAIGIVTFAISHVLIFANVGKRIRNLVGGTPNKLRLIYRFVTIVQVILSVMLTFIFIQIQSNSSYQTGVIIAIVSISYCSGIINLGILAERFIKWIYQNRSYISLLFSLATISILFNYIISVSFVVSVLKTQPSEIGWHLGILSPVPTGAYDVLQSLYSISFIISYSICWLSTVMVLHGHSDKLGKAKFWALVILPLLYILGEFQNLILPFLSEYRAADPVTFTIAYKLIFTSLKIAGSFFFGIGFWSMARKIERKSVKGFLNISAYGLILVFVTNQVNILLNTLYPPLGLMTACFIGLSSFLLLVGTYSAAVSVSNDATIRRAIRTSVENESKLIGDIGSAQLEMQLKTKVSSMMNKLSTKLKEDTEIESSLTDDDIRNYTSSAIEEIRRKSNKSSKA